MPFYFFDWTPEILEHLVEHDVTPEEFEDVVSDPDRQLTSRSTGDPIAFGWTSTGRYLCCVYRLHDDGMCVESVTAYEIGD
jgi:hypothetical protein